MTLQLPAFWGGCPFAAARAAGGCRAEQRLWVRDVDRGLFAALSFNSRPHAERLHVYYRPSTMPHFLAPRFPGAYIVFRPKPLHDPEL